MIASHLHHLFHLFFPPYPSIKSVLPVATKLEFHNAVMNSKLRFDGSTWESDLNRMEDPFRLPNGPSVCPS
jgi:hypothetical protein